MGAFIARQPNGRLCRHSTIVDCVTHYNMTDEAYIDGVTCSTKGPADARDNIDNWIKPFSWIEEWFEPNNMTEEEFSRLLFEMSQPAPEDVAFLLT